MTHLAPSANNFRQLTLAVALYEHVDDVARRACKLAMAKDRHVHFRFNDIAVNVGPLDELNDVLDRYHRDYELAQQRQGDDEE